MRVRYFEFALFSPHLNNYSTICITLFRTYYLHFLLLLKMFDLHFGISSGHTFFS